MPRITKELKKWFDYPNDPDGGKVLIRLIKPGEVQIIRDKSRELRSSYIEPLKQTETVLKLVGFRSEIACAAVKEWENFFDEEGKPLTCDKTNIRLMCLEAEFNDFIDECLAVLEQEQEQIREGERKN